MGAAMACQLHVLDRIAILRFLTRWAGGDPRRIGMKRYVKPSLIALGLLRLVTKYSLDPNPGVLYLR
jgi:hypothetical protein